MLHLPEDGVTSTQFIWNFFLAGDIYLFSPIYLFFNHLFLFIWTHGICFILRIFILWLKSPGTIFNYLSLHQRNITGCLKTQQNTYHTNRKLYKPQAYCLVNFHKDTHTISIYIKKHMILTVQKLPSTCQSFTQQE